MNRIDKLFSTKKEKILSIYFTAGHPKLSATTEIITTLQAEGVDLIEIGIPFSDPLADGPVIQKSSHSALRNGISLNILFEQLKDIRKTVDIPLILMGYLNPVLQYGIEAFCKKCSEIGIDGIILPDLPLDIYTKQYKKYFEINGLHNVFLITPQTSDERIRQLDSESGGFLYMVAVSATTGMRNGFEQYQADYFARVEDLNLSKPRLIGFGISNHETFTEACRHANGAIIGSAFVDAIDKTNNLTQTIVQFIGSVKKPQ